MSLYEFEGRKPIIGKGCFIHPEATLIGAVTIGDNCYIGPGARLRADWCDIVVGQGSNIQDNCVIHGQPGETIRLGPNSHIGHGTVLHTVCLGDHVTIGMGSILLDGVRVGDGCLVAAGSLLPPGSEFLPGQIIMGSPAKVTGPISEEMAGRLWFGTRLYQGLPERYVKAFRPCGDNSRDGGDGSR